MLICVVENVCYVYEIMSQTFKFKSNMSIEEIKNQEKPSVWVQFQITEKEYADIQRAKANSENPRGLNKDFYRALILKAITLTPL